MKIEALSDSFFHKLVQKEINKIPQNLFTALDQLYKDNWDIDINSIINRVKHKYRNYDIKTFNKHVINNIFDLPLIIKIGDIEISNGKNKHIITDLYVQLIIQTIFRSNSLYINSPEGTRTSASLEELKSNYFHSHLSGVNANFQSFCLGSNYSLKDFFGNIEADSVEHYLLMLITLKQSLCWESISGTPYRYLERIGKAPLEQDIPDYVYGDLLKKIYFKSLKFKITDNNIQVLPTKELEQQLFDQIKNTSYNTYSCYKTEFGEYLAPSHFSSNVRDEYISTWQDKDMFVFKGEMLKFKINNLIKQENVAENNAPNPKLTAGICKELSNSITKKHITNSRIKRENTIESSKECSETNPISVL